MIIQSISLLDQLDKDINTFSMRIRLDNHSMRVHWNLRIKNTLGPAIFSFIERFFSL